MSYPHQPQFPRLYYEEGMPVPPEHQVVFATIPTSGGTQYATMCTTQHLTLQYNTVDFRVDTTPLNSVPSRPHPTPAMAQWQSNSATHYPQSSHPCIRPAMENVYGSLPSAQGSAHEQDRSVSPYYPPPPGPPPGYTAVEVQQSPQAAGPYPLWPPAAHGAMVVMPKFPCTEMHSPETSERYKRHDDDGRRGMLPQRPFRKILPHLELLSSNDDAGASTQSPMRGIPSRTEGHVVGPAGTYSSEDNILGYKTHRSRKPIQGEIPVNGCIPEAVQALFQGYHPQQPIWAQTQGCTGINVETTTHRCKECKTYFSDADSLKRHLSTTIPHAKPRFRCEICKKRYTRSDVLRIHREQHFRPDVTEGSR